MKKLLAAAGLAALVFAEFTTLSVMTAEPANAAVCARGYRGAACAGPRGVVAVGRPRVYRPVRVYRRW